MSMTRDTYAKEVIRVAEAAFYRNETVKCPHEGCEETLDIVQMSMLSSRSLVCPTHGHIYQEQEVSPFGKLDWEAASNRPDDEFSGFDWDDEDDSEDSLEIEDNSIEE